MKVFSNSVTFDYSWEEVSTANWRKYCPWNDKSTHVIAVDTLSRSVDPETGVLRTERLITCRQSVPDWLKTLLGNVVCNGGESHVFETSYVNTNARTVTMVSQNVTWSNLLSVQETVVYRPAENSPGSPSPHHTQFVQDAKITALCGGWQRIRNAIEDSLVTRFRDNAAKGREGFESVLAMSRRVFAEEKEREKLLASATAAAVAAAGNPFHLSEKISAASSSNAAQMVAQ
ncbi:mitochondrial protein sorting [Grosmannia clavigera kw1407]|uniref:Mitochondrial protein sorting n=1 Tax=Grosmannia clavigera (strain kw1407 / UAMH 11150) TaxID=655863 RepID=F0XCY5_GROCL|nr:mitochondrial protein sorting [Grosmannia clavigera kw1407]EFX04358.1 mitochondrial protein sorting [Grosmannia clavigera kw1407]